MNLFRSFPHSARFKLTALVVVGTLLNACGGGGGRGDSLVLTELSSSAQQPAVITVSFKAKTYTGEPVADLTIANFEVLENDKPISLYEATPSLDKDPDEFVYNTLLLLDLSGSVLANSFETLKSAAATFIDTAIADANNDQGSFQIKLAYFDGRENIQNLSEYTSNKQTLLASLDSLDSSSSVDSSTNLYGAMVQGVADIDEVVEGFNISGVVSAGSLVVFTDGNDQAARVTKSTAQSAIDRAAEGLTIFTIGLEGEVDQNVLSQLGRDGTSFATDISGLVAAFNDIAARINAEANSIYLFKYCSPKRSGDANKLTIIANRDGEKGHLYTKFSASGFSGGCVIQ